MKVTKSRSNASIQIKLNRPKFIYKAAIAVSNSQTNRATTNFYKYNKLLETIFLSKNYKSDQGFQSLGQTSLFNTITKSAFIPLFRTKLQTLEVKSENQFLNRLQEQPLSFLKNNSLVKTNLITNTKVVNWKEVKLLLSSL